MSALAAAALETAGPPSEAPRFVRRLLGRKLALVCIVYLIVIVLVAIIAPIVLPWVSKQYTGDFLAVDQGPSWHHVLGTDTAGRDVLERLLVGTRVTMEGVLEALIVVLAVGVPGGLAAGYLGGWVDRVVGWLADLTFSIPAIIVTIIVLSVFPGSMLAGMCTFGLIASPGLMRIVRSATLPVREELYIAAARVSGLSRPYIITRHVLPRVAGAIIVQASLLSALALLTQSGLALLGLVVAAPAPSWGGMVANGIGVLELNSWLIWPPGIIIALTILAFGLLGDAARDASSEGWSAGVRRPDRTGLRGRLTSRRERDAVHDVHERGESRAEQPTPREDGELLTVDGLSVAFSDKESNRFVLEGVTFDVRLGETVGLVGESGCGKSMTALAILGLLPGSAAITSGHIYFEGRDLAALSERDLRAVRGKDVALISQEPMISLDPAFRVGSQLEEALRRHHKISRRAARARTLELLDSVQLPDPKLIARRYPHELSGGMAQRVAIARALSGEPKLLIADEPTTALDVTVQAEVLELLRELQRAHGMAILLVTHDWGVVADMCERAVVMYAGQVVERAELVQMFREPLHPYTEALLASNPQKSPDSELLPTIPGTVPRPGQWPAGCHFHPRCGYATDACRENPIPLERPRATRETRCIHYEDLARS